jgi:hypothetical protein
MSLQAAVAAAAADAAKRAWKQHQAQCAGCTKGSTSRGSSTRCAAGKQLRAAAVTAVAEMERERQADKAPDPGQEALF